MSDAVIVAAARTPIGTARKGGLIEVPGLALNRHCASGMGAVQGAAASIIAGMDTVAIAGGSESMSTTPTTMKRTPYTDDYAQWMSPSHPEQPDAPAFD